MLTLTRKRANIQLTTRKRVKSNNKQHIERRYIMKRFELLRKHYLQDREEQREQNIFFIKKGFLPTWSESEQKESDNGLKRYSTNLRWEQYQNGTITREKAEEFAIKRMNKQLDKEIQEKLFLLESVESAPDIDFIYINIEWKRSSTWGHNPLAEVSTDKEAKYNTGYASGCGYDKESAAVATAFNKSLAILKVLYTLKEKGLQAGESDESKTSCSGVDNRNIVGYGAGYSVIPYFEGGVGVGCFWEILKKAGFVVSSTYGKRETIYRVSKGV